MPAPGAIIAAYKAGATLGDIACDHGCSWQAVLAIVRKAVPEVVAKRRAETRAAAEDRREIKQASAEYLEQQLAVRAAARRGA